MEKKVSEFIKEFHMIEPNDCVIAGVSGGADSVCLLFLLCSLREEMQFQLEVAHVNHKIRMEASVDEDFVRKLCQRLQVPFHLYSEDVQSYAQKKGISVEEAGREVRYAFFEQCLGERKGKIAVAHNCNDQAETVLFHMFRGADLSGIRGMKPVRNHIIRPLLSCTREEIEEYLNEIKEEYCIDQTNLSDHYNRNKIRHHILPYAEEEVTRGAVKHISRTAQKMGLLEDYLENQTENVKTQMVRISEKGKEVDIDELKELHPYIREKLIYALLCETAGRIKDIGEKHVQTVLGLLNPEGTKEADLPYGIHILKEYRKLIFQTCAERKNEDSEEVAFEQVPIKGSINSKFLGMIETRLFPYEKNETIPEKPYTKWFDYDKISRVLEIRNRQKGDLLSIKGGTQKLQDFMINSKIPKENRSKVPMIAEGNQIVWIPGYRIGENYKVSEQTKTVLEIRIYEGGNNERTY